MIKHVILLVILFFNIQPIATNSSSNTVHYLNNCSSNTILLNAVNKTMEEITDITIKNTLYKIEDLLKRLDCNVSERILRSIYLQSRVGKVKQYHNVVDLRREYTRLNNNISVNNRIAINDNKGYIVVKDGNDSYIENQNNRIDPFLIIINIISIASFAIGIYVFRIIKKRIDYI